MKKALAVLGLVLLVGLNIQGGLVYADNYISSSTMHFTQYQDYANAYFSTAGSAKQATTTAYLSSPKQVSPYSDTKTNGGQAYIKVKLSTYTHTHSVTYK